MNGFDIAILAIVAISALLAFARGFVREALSMAAMFVAVLAVLWGFPLFRGPLRTLITTGWLADAINVGGIFILVYIAVRLATGRIHEWIHDSEPLGILDRTAGLLFGVARGFALVGVACLIVTSIAPPSMMPKAFLEARFYPMVMLTADALKHLAPQAGQAATDMARGAAAAGEGLAQTQQRDRAETMDSSIDGGPFKAQKTPDSGSRVHSATPTTRSERESEK
ncbi:CvpA family protein [Candidatus Phycosocius spiralis]|uniref:CvpA family protein n=1 Tax=Candidatus Phycosocius spiralis TaxID=2815099 RepID=A0ABQ4PW63_9PROT|nr:CvpA family protein [Candidatus Phycosocius spiralis]GIU67243.1 hypothetical protein PsB1_1397 [Candidatus Phycosocius spiralis]